MAHIGAHKAKARLSKLLDRVARGEKIVITRYGVPVAVLQPIDRKKQMDPKVVIEQIKEFRKKNRLDGISLRELVEEGRR